MQDKDCGDVLGDEAEKNNFKKYGRRDVLKTTAGLGMLTLAPSSVTADNGSSVKEAGVSHEFNQLIDDCKVDEALKLLDENGVNYTKVTESISANTEGVSTQDFYDKGSSSVTFYTNEWDKSKNEYAIGLGWTVEGYSNGASGPAPVDVPVLAFEDDIFGYVDDSARGTGNVEDHDGGSEVDGKLSIKSEPGNPHEDAPGNSLIAEFTDDVRDSNLDFYPVGQGVIQMVIRKQNTSSKGIVSGLYTHTWSSMNVGKLPILDNLSITIPGTGISVSVPSGVDKWELPNSTDRDQEI
ncbi:hypothetical protein [Haloterrigena thermotolerans]